MPKITKTLVNNIRLEGSAQRQYFWDTDLRGFGIAVYSSGRKSYVVQYRNREDRTRRLKIGQAGALTPEQARSEARQILAAVDRGEDPLEERQEEREAPTMEELAERYMREHALPKKKLSSVQRDESILRVILIPALGRRKVADVTRADVARLHHSLHKTPVQANRTVGLLSKMMNLAERWGLRPDHSNPCRHIDKYRERARERYLSKEELARLGKTLDEAERTGSVPDNILLVLRLLLFTGCRRGEIQKLRWEEVDLDRGILHLKDSKTGPKIIPLSRPALELLVSAPRFEGNPYVCAGERGSHVTTVLDKYWKIVRTTAQLEDLRLHDLRHTFASIGVAGQLGLPVIGRLLGHTQMATTQRYAHLATDPLRAASDLIARELEAALAGGDMTGGRWMDDRSESASDSVAC